MGPAVKPRINNTDFGAIMVEGVQYDHDIFITLSGEVKKRKKKLSKAIYGTSHVISLDEIAHIYQEGAKGIVIGTGQYGACTLSDEAHEYLDRHECKVRLMPTPDAIREWNRTGEHWIGIFHITC